MSTMLEQAIIDAKALKESALKTAEQTVIEKYSSQIKEAVERLLEKDDMEEEGGEVLDMPSEEEANAEEEMLDVGEEMGDVSLSLKVKVPFSVTEDEAEEVEIDFGELEKEIKKQMEYSE